MRFAFKLKRRVRLLGRLHAWALAWVSLSIQAAVTISPVIVNVSPDGRAIITVRNDRQREVLYQITVLQWQQIDGQDRYEATQDFIASPPLFTLAPAASQVVRMGFRNPVRLQLEQSYRLLLAEVPRPGDHTGERGLVQFAMQYAIPVFVASSQGAEPRHLVWQMREEGGALRVRADNLSSSHVALNMVGLTRQAGPTPPAELSHRQRTTVLAHAWREWRFVLPRDKSPLPWRIVVLPADRQAVELVPDADVRPHAF
ncbi:fimbrial biogenesis chaperone [Limnohabitans sp.]